MSGHVRISLHWLDSPWIWILYSHFFLCLDIRIVSSTYWYLVETLDSIMFWRVLGFFCLVWFELVLTGLKSDSHLRLPCSGEPWRSFAPFFWLSWNLPARGARGSGWELRLAAPSLLELPSGASPPLWSFSICDLTFVLHAWKSAVFWVLAAMRQNKTENKSKT